MTYQDINGILLANHFYPDRVEKNGEITELHVECPSLILIEDRATRIRQVLAEAGANCRVDCIKNNGYILIRKEN